MTKVLFGILLLLSLAVPADALELTAPEVPGSGSIQMPENTDSLGNGLLELLQHGIDLFYPELEGALKITTKVFFAAILCSVLSIMPEFRPALRHGPPRHRLP